MGDGRFAEIMVAVFMLIAISGIAYAIYEGATRPCFVPQCDGKGRKCIWVCQGHHARIFLRVPTDPEAE